MAVIVNPPAPVESGFFELLDEVIGGAVAPSSDDFAGLISGEKALAGNDREDNADEPPADDSSGTGERDVNAPVYPSTPQYDLSGRVWLISDRNSALTVADPSLASFPPDTDGAPGVATTEGARVSPPSVSAAQPAPAHLSPDGLPTKATPILASTAPVDRAPYIADQLVGAPFNDAFHVVPQSGFGIDRPSVPATDPGNPPRTVKPSLPGGSSLAGVPRGPLRDRVPAAGRLARPPGPAGPDALPADNQSVKLLADGGAWEDADKAFRIALDNGAGADRSGQELEVKAAPEQTRVAAVEASPGRLEDWGGDPQRTPVPQDGPTQLGTAAVPTSADTNTARNEMEGRSGARLYPIPQFGHASGPVLDDAAGKTAIEIEVVPKATPDDWLSARPDPEPNLPVSGGVGADRRVHPESVRQSEKTPVPMSVPDVGVETGKGPGSAIPPAPARQVQVATVDVARRQVERSDEKLERRVRSDSGVERPRLGSFSVTESKAPAPVHVPRQPAVAPAVESPVPSREERAEPEEAGRERQIDPANGKAKASKPESPATAFSDHGVVASSPLGRATGNLPGEKPLESAVRDQGHATRAEVPEPVRHSSVVRDLRVALEGPGEERIEIRATQHRTAIAVTVRTPNDSLGQSIRQSVDSLVGSLDSNGFELVSAGRIPHGGSADNGDVQVHAESARARPDAPVTEAASMGERPAEWTWERVHDTLRGHGEAFHAGAAASKADSPDGNQGFGGGGSGHQSRDGQRRKRGGPEFTLDDEEGRERSAITRGPWVGLSTAGGTK